MNIAVKQYQSAAFQLNEDMNLWHCNHESAYIEPACCSGYDSEGLISCGCRGQDSVICPAWDCDGIEDYEVDSLLDRLTCFE